MPKKTTYKTVWTRLGVLGAAIVLMGGVLSVIGIDTNSILPVTRSVYAEDLGTLNSRIDQNTISILTRDLLNFRRERRSLEAQINSYNRRNELPPQYLLRDQADISGQTEDLTATIQTLRRKLSK